MLFSDFHHFGFSGSRSCPQAVAAAQQVFAHLPSGAQVSVGCAAGVDSAVRSHFPLASVFSVADFGGAAAGRAAFAARSAALVRSVGSAGGLLLVFPSGSCPAEVQPGPRFQGFGSGSWGSAALAVGCGFHVAVWVPAGVAVPGWLSAMGSPVPGGQFWSVAPPPSLFS